MIIPGSSDCTGLINNNWVMVSDIWHMKLYLVLDNNGEFYRHFTLVMVDDYNSPIGDAVEINMKNPIINRFPSNFQITGLTLEYLDLKLTHGYEKNVWSVTDFENGNIDIKCDELY